MAYYLAKTEPLVYSIGQFQKDVSTTWDGIKNPQALRAVKAMKPGDRVFIYHSGGMSAIAGLAEVVSEARDDPKNPKSSVVDMKYLMHIEPTVSLREIKDSHEFDDWALVRQSRLSTMEVPAKFVKWMRARYPALKL